MFRGARGVRRKVSPQPQWRWHPALAVPYDAAGVARGRNAMAAAAPMSAQRHTGRCGSGNSGDVPSTFLRRTLDVRIDPKSARSANAISGRFSLSTYAAASVQHRSGAPPFFQPSHPRNMLLSEDEEPFETGYIDTESKNLLNASNHDAAPHIEQKYDERFSATHLWNRYTPRDNIRLAPISSSSIADTPGQIRTAIERSTQEEAWSAFVSHLQQLRITDDRQTSRLPPDVFDACFWLIASEDTDQRHHHRQLARQTEILNRTRILLEYADAVGIEVTKLQVRRFIYLSVTLWEQQSKEWNEVSNKVDVSLLVSDAMRFCADLDSILVSRIVTRLVRIGNFEDVLLFAQEWRRHTTMVNEGESESRRIESWTRDGQALEPDFVHASLQRLGVTLEHKTLALVVSRAIQHNALDLAVVVLGLGDADLTRRSVSRMLHENVSIGQLWLCVPTELRETIQQVMPASPIRVSGPCRARLQLHSAPADIREKLFFAASNALTMAGDIRLATWLTLHSREGDAVVPFDDAKLARIALDAALVLANRSLHCSKEDEARALELAALSMRFMERWRSRGHSLRSQVHNRLIIALQRRLYLRGGTAKRNGKIQEIEAADSTSLLRLTRRLTQDVIAHDPNLRRLDAAGSLAILLKVHIDLRDYAFAMQLFSLAEGTDTSPLDPKGFLWLLQAALTDGKSSKHVAARLFVHWLTSDLRNDDKLPILPTAVLRLLFKNLLKHSRFDQALLLEPYLTASRGGLQTYRKGGKRALSSLSRDSQVSRWLGTLKQVPEQLSSASLGISLRILQLRREDNELRGLELRSNLIALHNELFAGFAQVAPLRDSLQRAQVLSTFDSLRSQAMTSLDAAPDSQTYVRDVGNALKLSYISALQILQADMAASAAPKIMSLSVDEDDIADAKAMRAKAERAELLLHELRAVWRWNIEAHEQQAFGNARTFTTSQILSLAARNDMRGAHARFVEDMESFQRWATENADRSSSKDRPAADTTGAAPASKARYVCKPLPVSLTSRLALALGRAGDFGSARDVLSLYVRCTQDVVKPRYHNITSAASAAERGTVVRKRVDGRRASIECAGIALLCMQDRKQEALDRIYSLDRLGVFGTQPQDSDDGRSPSPAARGSPSAAAPNPDQPLSMLGPSNAQLSKLFAKVVRSIMAVQRYSDWGGALEEACDKLEHWTTDVPSAESQAEARVYYDDSSLPACVRTTERRGQRENLVDATLDGSERGSIS